MLYLHSMKSELTFLVAVFNYLCVRENGDCESSIVQRVNLGMDRKGARLLLAD